MVGTLFLLPVIVAYTAWSYWVFRGKALPDQDAHSGGGILTTGGKRVKGRSLPEMI